MGNSTIQLSQVVNTLAAKGIPDPRGTASGYGDQMAFDLATQVMADIVCERFNWPWNRAKATPFSTNGYQQDYPQLAQPDGPIGWGEDCDAININNTSMPKPVYNPIWRRQLSRVSVSAWRFANLSWMYNKDMFLGVWPGPGKVFAPLITTAPTPQNPIMNMVDVNGNILIVTGFGTTFAGAVLDIDLIELDAATDALILSYTGANLLLSDGLQVTFAGLTRYPALNGRTLPIAATESNSIAFVLTGATSASGAETGTMTIAAAGPQLPANSDEGATVPDGTVTWTCVSPTSQGFRVSSLPPAAGPSWLVEPSYQLDPVKFGSWKQTLDPIPDSFSRFFYRGLESELLIASPNPGDLKRGQAAKAQWMEAMVEAMKQGDRSPNVYSLIPAMDVVEPRWGYNRGPYTADQPY